MILKYRSLLESLQKFKKIAVAFSGGVDSTLLVHAAQEALGPNNVLILYARSTLLAQSNIKNAREVCKVNLAKTSLLKEIELFPLSWMEFVKNTGERCYYCKKRIYTQFKAVMEVEGFNHLADGTNVDDLQQSRPGLQAILELKVITPLVDAGMTKKEIRSISQINGLSNYNLPSNSCLATRIQPGKFIKEKDLRIIESAELFLHELGFYGCRVKPQGVYTFVEVQIEDIKRVTAQSNRVQIRDYFQLLDLGQVVLNLDGR